MERRAQISIEYLMIIGFVLVVLGALIVVYFNHQTSQSRQVSAEQADSLARDIVDAAEEVYYLGEPSKRTIRIFMPQGVDSVSISDNELVFYIRGTGGISEIERPSSVNISGSLSPSSGVRDIEITAGSNYVCIAEKGSTC